MSHLPEGRKSNPTTRIDGPRQLLVVDDDPMVLAATVALLKARDWHAMGVPDGTLALETLKKSPGRFAGILIDFILPDMSGGELLQQIRILAPEIPVILCSGMDADQVEIPHSGRPHVFLKKPYRMADMERTLQLALEPLN